MTIAALRILALVAAYRERYGEEAAAVLAQSWHREIVSG